MSTDRSICVFVYLHVSPTSCTKTIRMNLVCTNYWFWNKKQKRWWFWGRASCWSTTRHRHCSKIQTASFRNWWRILKWREHVLVAKISISRQKNQHSVFGLWCRSMIELQSCIQADSIYAFACGLDCFVSVFAVQASQKLSKLLHISRWGEYVEESKVERCIPQRRGGGGGGSLFLQKVHAACVHARMQTGCSAECTESVLGKRIGALIFPRYF